MKKSVFVLVAILLVSVGIAFAVSFFSGESIKLSETAFPSPTPKESIFITDESASPSAAIVSMTKTVITLQATEDGQNAYQLTKDTMRDVREGKFSYGVMVTGINYVYADEENFWALYVGNELATQSADKTILAKGDTITWKYESIDSAGF